ncbi:MAG: hypothetical protein IJI43_04510 [Bacilli bacterium]|nr:hypothetical protein [Bacilli bacterium]
MSKSNKIIIIFIIFIVVYAIVFFILLGGPKRLSQEKNTATIILDSVIWNYEDNNWTNITQEDSISKLNWKKYTVYEDDKKLGNYYLWYDGSKWYLFDKDRNSKEYYGELLAYKANYDIKMVKFAQKDIDNYDYIEEVLETKKIDLNADDYVVSNQIDIDIDKDGQEETFYIVSNSNIYGVTGKTFSLVLMVKNNKTHKLYFEVKDSEEMTCLPYIRAFMDVDDDDKLETIVGCESLTGSNKRFLYKYTDKNKYEILISNR